MAAPERQQPWVLSEEQEQRAERADRRLAQLIINVRSRMFSDRVNAEVRRRADLLNSETAARESVADDSEAGRLRP